MEVIREDDREVIEKAVEVLKAGGMIIYPTDTCYGLGVDATNEEAIQKVYVAKRRPTNKPISVAFSDINMVKKFLDIDDTTIKLVEKFMPGPITLVIRNKNLPEMLGGEKIGFRIPNRESVREIIKKFGRPITTTSANISGEEPIYDPEEAKRRFWSVVDLLIDGGILSHIKPSTVFDVEKRMVLRPGPISEDEILKVIG